MKLTPWMLTVAIFLIVAALAVGFLFKKLFAKEVIPPVAESVRRVPMMTSPVEAGTRIETSHLGSGPWDGDLTPDTLLSRDSIVGRIARDDIDPAKPLSSALFYPVGQLPPIELQPGTRAVSVNLRDNTAMVDGLIGQGSFVDVWMTIDANLPVESEDAIYTRRRRDSLSLKLFDGVKIIAINGSLKGGSRIRGSVVTMELDARQQAIMVAARDKGSITLTANPEGPGSGGLSVDMSENDRVTLREILGIEETEIRRPFVSETYRGQQRSVQAYDKDGKRIIGNQPGYDDPGTVGAGRGIDAPVSANYYTSRRPTQQGQAVDRSQITGATNNSL